MLKELSPGLLDLGYLVESGKTKAAKISRPVLFGENGDFHRMFKERAVAAGVPVVSVHSTRHVCASLLVELEVHPRVAMQVLRHSRIGVTMDIYSQVAAAGTRDALSRLGSLLSE